MADSASPESKILNTLKADNNLGSFSINPALKSLAPATNGGSELTSRSAPLLPPALLSPSLP